jgi:2-keto-4-pentenoate hydratase/2-oxohepta-3-ene-1,7-dioic acid hydratase in catechol pathway
MDWSQTATVGCESWQTSRMRIARFRHAGKVAFGLIEEENLKVIVGEPYSGIQLSGEVLSLSSVELLAPTVPSKVICIGMNYSAHAAEISQDVPDEPLMFFKPSSSVTGPGAPIVLPPQSDQVELECELTIVVGKEAKNVPIDLVGDYILGFTIANDVTARDLQFSDLQWARSKGFDTFCPMGPWIDTEFDPERTTLESRINGTVRQEGSTRDMNFGVYELFSYVSQNVTLYPGDVILTGSPAGLSRIQKGDVVECEIKGLGVLSNPVT